MAGAVLTGKSVMGQKLNLTGRRYSNLIAYRRANKPGSYWECLCDCGNLTIVLQGNLTTGHSKSCGCRRGEKHGQSNRSPTYYSWLKMRERCNNPRNNRYYAYGGRGISVCSSWNNSFLAFLNEMGERPNGTSIDRIDVNGDYKPENCRWATQLQQATNKRKNSVDTKTDVE